MIERIDKLRGVADSTAIKILDSQLAELTELTATAESSGRSSDIKAMLDKRQALERALNVVEDMQTEEQFDNKSAVLKYFEDNGYKVAARTFDDHIKKGKLYRTPYGGFLKADVEKYAKENLTRKESEDLQEQLKTVQLERARISAEREQARLAEEQGRLINRDKVGLEFAARIEEMKKLFDEVAEKLPVELFGRDHARMKEIIIAHHRYILESYSRKLEVLSNGGEK